MLIYTPTNTNNDKLVNISVEFQLFGFFQQNFTRTHPCYDSQQIDLLKFGTILVSISNFVTPLEIDLLKIGFTGKCCVGVGIISIQGHFKAIFHCPLRIPSGY